jgi:hypothetical protein
VLSTRDVQVVGQDEDGCSCVAATHPDVVEPAVVPQGQLAVGVDRVVADAEVAGDERDAACGLGSGGVGLGRGLAADGPVLPDGVVVGLELVRRGL